MKENTRERPNNGRQSTVATKIPARTAVISCKTDTVNADSEDPLGPQTLLVSDNNLAISPPGEAFQDSEENPSVGHETSEPTENSSPAEPYDRSETSVSTETSEIKKTSEPTETSGRSKAFENEPKRFKSYDLLWEHSKDALSTTFAVKNGAVDKILSLRLFNARVSDSLLIKEILRAATTASELTHLHLATVYESGTDETGAPYVVSDLVEGSNLAEVLQLKKRLDIAGFLNIFNQVGEALIEAHGHELFHGNLSPDKIVLTPNEIDTDMVKLVDFGMPLDPVRNAFYLSPEQCLDRSRSDARSDIYSLGCIMYEALVGTPPFVGSNASQAALNYLHELANQFSKDSPEHNALKLLDCIIIKCLQKKPAKRFRNVRELMNALQLVNDCICNGSTKKLPPKAEKLLLFRFLDLFGNKIAACATAYLIFGFVCMKVIGEVNLQKHIDQAALCAHLNDFKAKDSWKEAINQAKRLHKPPSFMAALHYALGDTYNNIVVTHPYGAENTNAKNAIAEYEKAYDYFKHGNYFKAHRLGLLRESVNMLTHMRTKDFDKIERSQTLKKVQELWLAKRYAECAKVAENFLQKGDDKRLSFYAANANTELALALPAAKALRYFERAAYHFSNCRYELNFECDNLAICITRLGMVPDSSDTRNALGYAALEAGDLRAAYAEFIRSRDANDQTLAGMLRNFIRWRIEPGTTNMLDPYVKASMEPLEKILALESEATNNDLLLIAPTLLDLAKVYRACGQDEKAISLYKRLMDTHWGMFDDQLAYADLLVKVGRKAEARKFLEETAADSEGIYDISNPVTVRLMKAYGDDGMKPQLRDMLLQFTRYRQPQRIISTGYFTYPVVTYANRPYSRNGVIFRK